MAPSRWSLVADIPSAQRQLLQTYQSKARLNERGGCQSFQRQLSLSQGCGFAGVAIIKQTAFGTQNLTALLKPPPKFLLPQDPYAAITATYIGNSLQCKHLPQLALSVVANCYYYPLITGGLWAAVCSGGAPAQIQAGWTATGGAGTAPASFVAAYQSAFNATVT